MSLAVVFDSAGTLMKTVRAVFSTKTKTISHGEETTLLVFEDAFHFFPHLFAMK